MNVGAGAAVPSSAAVVAPPLDGHISMGAPQVVEHSAPLPVTAWDGIDGFVLLFQDTGGNQIHAPQASPGDMHEDKAARQSDVDGTIVIVTTRIEPERLSSAAQL